jgi:molybdopterin molybdotransferase
VTIMRPVLPNSNLVPRGEEIQEGDLLLKKGFFLTPPAIGLLAAVGTRRNGCAREYLCGLTRRDHPL